jgi:phage shock protein A
MPPEPSRSFVGVLLGFACVFFLFAKRDKKPPQDDAEILLQLAQSQMREAQAKNRERAVQAITQKNNLQALVDQTQKMVTRLEERAETARQADDLDLEQGLLAERGQYLLTLTQTQASLASAIETTEAVKTAMRREEERIRAQTAQALAMKAQQRQALIELAIEKSRLGMTTSYASDLFDRAQAKIQQAQARRDLMARVRQTAEVLEAAAEEAAHNGDAALSRRLLAERDELKRAALNPKLWSS